MTPLALAFMVLSWSFVLGLTAWCFARVLRAEKRAELRDPLDDEQHADPGSARLP